MAIEEVTIGLAFLAGLASFLSPCVLTLVPAYVGYLGGRMAATSDERQAGRWITFTHGLAFVVGFSIVFVTLGVAASLFGGLLFDLRPWIAKVGGIIVIILGLHMTGIFRIRWLEYDLRPHSTTDRNRGYLASGLMGIFFSAGWSPCVGPVLGAILMLAANGGSISHGASLLTAYSTGLAIPFLIAAIGIGWVTKILKRYGKLMFYVEKVMGVILIIVGAMLFLGTFQQIARYFTWFTPSL